MKKLSINKDFFIKNNNIISVHLKSQWKILLFFIILWFAITLICLCMTIKNATYYFDGNIGGKQLHEEGNIDMHLPMIASGVLNSDGKSNLGQGYLPTSISSWLNWILFSGVEVAFFGIVALFFINRTFIREINNKQIVYWTNLPVSRTQILLSKYSFIIFAMFLIFIPSFVTIIIFSAIASDADEFIGSVIGYGIETFLFNIFILSIFFLIGNLLSKKNILFNIICSVICSWILISDIIQMLNKFNDSNNQIFAAIKYITIQNLIVNPLNFDLNSLNSHIIKTITVGNEHIFHLNLQDHKLISNPLWTYFVFPIIIIIIISLSNFGSYKIFTHKELTI